jgi:hypothetical protein
MDVIYRGAKVRKVPVQVTEDVNVDVVREVTERPAENVLPEVDVSLEVVDMSGENETEFDFGAELGAFADDAEPDDNSSALDKQDFDFDQELEKAFENVDFSDEAFKAGGSDDNIADIEDVATQMFVDESVPVVDEVKKTEPDEAPDANNYSLGSTENPFLPGARVDKRPLGVNVKPTAESANVTESTKNVYARREMLNRPVPMSAKSPTMIVENPKKKDHGFLWALLILFVTLLGAGAGALVYYLMYNK